MYDKKKLNTLNLDNKIRKAINICNECEDNSVGTKGFTGFVVSINDSEINVSSTHFEFSDNTFYICFLGYSKDEGKEDDYSEYQFTIDDIKNVVFDGCEELKILIITLHNGDVAMIHCID